MQIKSSWEELTFNEVLQIQQILSADINETYKASNVIAVLAGVDVDVIESLPLSKFTQLTKHLDFLKENPSKSKHQFQYTINDRTYDLCANISDITTAQYFDYSTYMKEEMVDMVKVTSVFLVPTGHKYNDGYDMNLVWEDIGQMKYIDIDAIAFFLRKQFALYTMITTDSLVHQLKKAKMKKKEIEQITTPLNSMASSLLS